MGRPVSYTIPSLFNGVSQQPDSIRHPSQLTSQVNRMSDLVKGLGKRAPTQHVVKLQTALAGNAFLHTINRDVVERYTVIITNGDLKVYDLAGNEKTVAFPDAKAYLTATNPRAEFAAVTIADFTFIVNKTTTVAMDPTQDGQTLTGTVQTFSNLPAGVTGNIYEIKGDANTQFDNYFVEKLATGVWKEREKPDLEDAFDASTMPHQLVRESSGDFTFQQATWGGRLAGDETTSEEPGFVGKKVTDVFFHRNRLGLTAGEAIVFSAAGEFFNFWRETATAVLDSDPIDGAVSHTKVSNINHAVPFNKSLLLFSDQTQFELSTDTVLTSKTVKIDQSTEFESVGTARPVGAGQNVFFATQRGRFSGIREYFVETNTVSNDAADVTGHVPEFLPKNIFKLAASSNEDLLLGLTTDNANRVYVYKYFWVGDEKVQSSWSFWEFDSGDTVLNVDFIQSEIWIAIERSDGVYLEKIQLQDDPEFADFGYDVLLDRRHSFDETDATYDAGNDETTWTLPYVDSGTFQLVLTGDYAGRKGEVVPITRPTSSTIKASGKFDTGDVVVGRVYNSSAELSKQFVRETVGEGSKPVLEGDLYLQDMKFSFKDTGYFEVHVKPRKGGDTFIDASTGRIIGESFVVGEVPITTGTFSICIGADAQEVTITVVNNSHLPDNITLAGWTGDFVLKHGRV